MKPTPHTEVNLLLDELLSRMRAALGASLLGLYLFGSLVAGDFDDDISDIDMLAVTAADITDDEFGVLDQMHSAFVHEHPAWDDRLDIVYISASALRAFGTLACYIAIISPGEPFHIIDADPGWLMNWYVVQEQGHSLHGPPPATFIRPISKDEYVEVVRAHARSCSTWVHLAHTRKSQAYAILTMCRALYTHTTGGHVSKKQAAAWAQAELPEWSALIQDALRWRTAWRDAGVDHAATFPETLRFVQFAIRQIAET
jgi:predicted nucleotidyltransferase